MWNFQKSKKWKIQKIDFFNFEIFDFSQNIEFFDFWKKNDFRDFWKFWDFQIFKNIFLDDKNIFHPDFFGGWTTGAWVNPRYPLASLAPPKTMPRGFWDVPGRKFCSQTKSSVFFCENRKNLDTTKPNILLSVPSGYWDP